MWYIARWNLNLPYICIDRYKLLCVIRVSNTPRMPRIWISLFMRTSRDISLRQFDSNSWIIKFLEDTLQLSLIDVMWKYIVYKVMKKRKKKQKEESIETHAAFVFSRNKVVVRSCIYTECCHIYIYTYTEAMQHANRAKGNGQSYVGGTDVHDRSFARFILPSFFSRLIVLTRYSLRLLPRSFSRMSDIRLL